MQSLIIIFFPINSLQYRSPVAAQRPSFRELLLALLDDPKVVLSIPPETIGANPLAGVLGSQLEAGENMYRDLQDRYRE